MVWRWKGDKPVPEPVTISGFTAKYTHSVSISRQGIENKYAVIMDDKVVLFTPGFRVYGIQESR